jgi:hypothetical protein
MRPGLMITIILGPTESRHGRMIHGTGQDPAGLDSDPTARGMAGGITVWLRHRCSSPR